MHPASQQMPMNSGLFAVRNGMPGIPRRVARLNALNSFAITAILLNICGCAATPYYQGSASTYHVSPELAATAENQIERGRPQAFVDGFGWIWGIPSKIILFNHRVENHRIGPETEGAIAAYLKDNELSTVKVRLNQYHPGDDWQRLRQNKSVGAGWRYTLGTLSVLGETIFPGRLFGGDHYNPFTNTIHVYSDVPAIAIHEGGHSKDFARRKWKGTYAAAYLVPGVPLYHEAIATGDALGYIELNGDPSDLQKAYNVLYPAYGTYIGSAFGDLSPVMYPVGVIAGHIAGRRVSWQIGRETRENPQKVRLNSGRPTPIFTPRR